MSAPTSEPFSFRSPQQRQLHERLAHFLGPGPAALYFDARRMLAEQTPYATTTHLVFHLLREIESSLRHVLLPYDTGPSTQGPGNNTQPEEENRKKQIEEIAKQYHLDTSFRDTWIALATEPEEENHKKQIGEIAKQYHLDTALRDAWIALATKSKNDKGFASFAHRDALAIPRPRDSTFDQGIEAFEQVLADVLKAFEQHSLHIFRLLDHLLSKSQPGKKDVTTLKNRIPANWVTYSYFFSRLQNPAWLGLLKDKHGFAPPLMDIQDGRRYYVPWPQADYLKKMAAQQSAHEQVLSILRSAAETENPHVQRALLEIATLLPATLAAQLVLSIKQWFSNPDSLWSVTSPLEAFLTHLIEGGEGSVALDLLEASLTTLTGRDSISERWEYEQLLLRSRALLATTHPQGFLHVLCRLLDVEVYQHFVQFRTLSEANTEVQQRAREASTIVWQQAIEAIGRPSAQGMNAPLHLLVATIRQTVEQAIEAQALTLSDAISLLDMHSGKIFRRLTLYSLSRFASHDPERVRSRLVQRSLFDDGDMHHEYILLTRAGLSFLSQEEQDTLFQWIEKGPDPERYQQYCRQVYQEAPTEEQVQQHKAHWQQDWLGQIADVLPIQWRSHYEALVSAFGTFEPEPSLESWSLAHRPFAQSIETYKAMSLEQLLETIQASDEEPRSGHVDLTRLLSTLIAEEPEQFAEQADRFQGQSPEIVSAALRGFSQASRGQHTLNWSHLMALCTWTVEQRFPLPEDGPSIQGGQPAWAEASKEVAALLLSAFQGSMASFPLPWRETIWSLLEYLAEDEYGLYRKTPHRVPQRYWYVAINSTRGLALQAIIEYARWLWSDRQTAPSQQEGDTEAWTFKQVPEVQAFLERFLAPGQDGTGVAHAVFGYYFPLLIHFDALWTTQHLSDIFPHQTADSLVFEAAWETYVLRTPPSREAFAALRNEYAIAIDRLDSDDKGPSSIDTPASHLASHFSIFLLRGDISLDPPESLLVQFFQRASDELRHRMVSEIGRILANDKENVSPQMLERCQHFWEWRIATISSSPRPDQSHRELSAFGWWICSGLFSPRWSVQHLARVLAFQKTIDMSSFVVHQLATLVDQEPELTLQCLNHLLQGETQSWGSSEWNKAVWAILLGMLQQQNAVMQERAKALISSLAMQGHTQYLELLRTL